MTQRLTILAAMLAICLLAAFSLANSHPGVFASALVKVEPDGRLIVTLRHDAGSGAAPYVNGTLLAVRRVVSVVGLVRGLDRLLFED